MHSLSEKRLNNKTISTLTPKNVYLKWFGLKGITIFLPLHHIYHQGLQRQQPEQHPDEIKALHQLQLAISSPLNNKREEGKQPVSKTNMALYIKVQKTV